MICAINQLFNRFCVSPPLLRHLSYKRSVVYNNNNNVVEDMFDIERDFENVKIETFKDIMTDDNIKSRVEIILNEYEYEKYMTLEVPISLTVDNMRDLLVLETKDERRQLLRHLCRKELVTDMRKLRRKEHSKEYWTQKRQTYQQINSERTGLWDHKQHLIYGLWHNSLFTKIEPKTVKKLFSHRLRNAVLFGQKLVIDLGFDDYMRPQDCRLLVNQIQKLYHFNKYRSVVPFDIHFTDCHPMDQIMQIIPKILVNYKKPHFLSSFHEKSYLKVFPKEKLVYLSPHSKETLTEYNCDDIYIIGGIVGKESHLDITQNKAIKEGIRCFRLPIDENVIWRAGSKQLPLDIISYILHDFSLGFTWSEALTNNIPKWQIKSIEEVYYEDKSRQQRYNHKNRLD
ncbi:mitochondrial ribonuclease P protein 1 homolog [Oppia nitens]|uniref:mitochondrial ribonuclease P protein 1 homolog n=1 Tax=Oppia nitens TaxID=1686743 RepID=UPI0023DC2465|nr:mitochondrial ribonuclease P protein 1 homolog [Oppia nitens]